MEGCGFDTLDAWQCHQVLTPVTPHNPARLHRSQRQISQTAPNELITSLWRAHSTCLCPSLSSHPSLQKQWHVEGVYILERHIRAFYVVLVCYSFRLLTLFLTVVIMGSYRVLSAAERTLKEHSRKKKQQQQKTKNNKQTKKPKTNIVCAGSDSWLVTRSTRAFIGSSYLYLFQRMATSRETVERLQKYVSFHFFHQLVDTEDVPALENREPTRLGRKRFCTIAAQRYYPYLLFHESQRTKSLQTVSTDVHSRLSSLSHRGLILHLKE